MYKCEGCGREVDANAAFCVGCGMRFQKEDPKPASFPFWLKALLAAAGASLVVLLSLSFVSPRVGRSGGRPSSSPIPDSDMNTPLGRAINAARLMNLMAGDDGFAVLRARLMPDGAACYQYGVGAARSGRAVLTPSNRLQMEYGGGLVGELSMMMLPREFERLWKQECSAAGQDETAQISAGDAVLGR